MSKRKDEDGIYIDEVCPHCHNTNCVQGLYNIDYKNNKVKHLLRCCHCDYRWLDVEKNKIEEIKQQCYALIDNNCEELETAEKLLFIIKESLKIESHE